MNWLNIHTPVLRSPDFIGSDPVARATWLYVTAYCCEQENDGVIKGAKEWKDRQWQQTCGVTLQEVQDSSPLLKFVGGDLFTLNYPSEKQAEVQAKREAGRRGGLRSASSRASSRASTEGEGEGNENMNGKGNGVSNGNVEITKEQAVSMASTAGVPPDFAGYIFGDWHSRDGKDAGGVKVKWTGYAKKRWDREHIEWENGAHKGSKKKSPQIGLDKGMRLIK